MSYSLRPWHPNNDENMARFLAALIGGVLLGIAGTWIVVAPESGTHPADEVVRDIDVVPQMTPEVAEVHRQERFEELTTVADIYALPDGYSRHEALYTVAGRSSAAGVQGLIFEANRIADRYEREQALNILFYRLTVLDPRSALALAQSEYFKGIRSLEQTVWQAWGRADLDDALLAARMLTDRRQQSAAARALYNAYGMLGNDTTDRIETELGIEPDEWTRARYIYRLADESAEAAIAWIDGLDSVAAQRENISWLAYYLSLQDAATAIAYAGLFEDRANQERYRSFVEGHAARGNPRLTLDRILASGPTPDNSSEFLTAVRELARTDMGAALTYFDEVSNPQYRDYLGSVIVEQMVRDDPQAALVWARENDTGLYARFEITALQLIARTDPQLAIDEAMGIEDSHQRSMALTSLVGEMSESDPHAAIAYLDRIAEPGQRQMATMQLSQSWLMQDPEAALDWLSTQDEAFTAEVLTSAGYQLINTNADLAIRLLPRLDEQSRQAWQRQIAQHLAMNRSLEEAQSFVSQFEGQPGYERMQASLISGLMMQDVTLAKQLADQLTDVAARDGVYMQIVTQRANVDPTEAMAWLSSISDESLRSAAAGQVAAVWYSQNPAAAQAWVSNLPRGAQRDDAIMQMSYQWVDATDEQLNLIASIGDANKRSQARIRRIYHVMRTDPALARRLLEDPDIPDHLRQQAEVSLSQFPR